MSLVYRPKSLWTGTFNALAKATISTSMTVRFPASIRLTSTRVRLSKPPAARRPAKSSWVATGLSPSLIFLTCLPTTLRRSDAARVRCRERFWTVFKEEFFRRTTIDYRKSADIEYFGRTILKTNA